MDAHLFGLVHDVAGPDPIALQVCVEAGVEPRGSQAVSGDDAFIHDLAAAPESREGNRPRASLGTEERARGVGGGMHCNCYLPTKTPNRWQ